MLLAFDDWLIGKTDFSELEKAPLCFLNSDSKKNYWDQQKTAWQTFNGLSHFMPEGIEHFLEQMVPELGGYPLYWLSKYFINSFSKIENAEPFFPPPDGTPSIASAGTSILYSVKPKCSLIVQPGHDLEKMMSMEEEPCEYRLSPGVHWVYKTLPFQEGDILTSAITAANDDDDDDGSNPGEVDPDPPIDSEDGSSELSTFHATPVLRINLRSKQTSEYYRLRNIKTNETLSTQSEWHSVVQPDPVLSARQPASFRITPVLRLGMNGQSSFSYYRLRVQSWQSIIPPENLKRVPVLKVAEAFEGDVLIDFARNSELHHLLIDMELMPLADDYPLCQRLFTSQTLSIRLQNLLFIGNHICDLPFPDEDPFQDFLALNLTGNIRQVPESKETPPGKPSEEQPSEEQPAESTDNAERPPNPPPPPPGGDKPDKHSDDPSQQDSSTDTVPFTIQVDLAGSLFIFMLSSTSFHSQMQVILAWLDHHKLGNQGNFSSQLKALVKSNSRKFPTQGGLVQIDAFAYKKEEKNYKRPIQPGSSLRNLLEAAIEGISQEQTLQFMAYLNHHLPGITWIMDDGSLLGEVHLSHLPEYKPLPQPRATTHEPTTRRRPSFRLRWGWQSSKRRPRYPPHPGMATLPQVQLSSEANALVDHLLTWVHSMDDYEAVLTWLDENFPTTATQCLQQLQSLMNLKISSANSLTGFWTNAPSGSKATFYASRSRTHSLEIFVSLLTTEEVGTMQTFSQNKSEGKKEDVVKEKPKPDPKTEDEPGPATTNPTTTTPVNAFAAFYASSTITDPAAKEPPAKQDEPKQEDKKPAPYVNLMILTPEASIPVLTDTQKSYLMRLMQVIKTAPAYRLSLISPIASRWAREVEKQKSGDDDSVKAAEKKAEELVVTAFRLCPPFKNLPTTPSYNDLSKVFSTIRPEDIEVSLTEPLAVALAHFITHEDPKVVEEVINEIAPEPKPPESAATPLVETSDKPEVVAAETPPAVPVLEDTPRLLTVDNLPPVLDSQSGEPLPTVEPSLANSLRERLRKMTWDIRHLKQVLNNLKSERAIQAILNYLKQLIFGPSLLDLRIIHNYVLAFDNTQQDIQLNSALQETEHQERIIELLLDNSYPAEQLSLYLRLLPKPPRTMTASQTFSPSQDSFTEGLSGYESQFSLASQSSMSIVSVSYQHGQQVQATLCRILQRLSSQSGSPLFMAQQLINLIQALVHLRQCDAGEVLITHLKHELQMPKLSLANYKLSLDPTQLSQQQLSILQRIRGLQAMATARGNEYQGSISNSPIHQHLQTVLSSIQTQNLNSFEQYFLRLYGQSWNTRGASLPPPTRSLERGRVPDFSGFTDDDAPLPERSQTMRRDHRQRRTVNRPPDYHQSMVGIHQPPSRRNYRHRTPDPWSYQGSHHSLIQPESTPVVSRPVSRARAMKKLQSGQSLTLKLERYEQQGSAANRGMTRLLTVDFQTRINNMLWVQHKTAQVEASQTRTRLGKALSWFKNHNRKEHRQSIAQVLGQFFTTVERVEELIYQLHQAQHQSFKDQTQAHDFIEFRQIPTQPANAEALLNWVLEQYFTPVRRTSRGGVSAAMALTIQVMLTSEQLADLAQQLEQLVRASRSTLSPDVTSPSSSMLLAATPDPYLQDLAQVISSMIYDENAQKQLDQHLQPFIAALENRLSRFARSQLPHIYIQNAITAGSLAQLLQELTHLMTPEQWQAFERAIRRPSSSLV